MKRSILCQKFIDDSYKEIIFGTQTGYCIYNITPFNKVNEENLGGGIGIIDINKNNKLIYIIGGGLTPCYPPNKLIIRDYDNKENIKGIYFNDIILNLYVRNDVFILSTEHKIYVYNADDYSIIREIPSNTKKGLFSINTLVGHNHKLRLLTLSNQKGCLNLYDKHSEHILNIIKLHDSSIEYFTINKTGDFIASCSCKGTVIKVYDCNKKCYKEYRRGYNQNKIHYLKFNDPSDKLICISDTSLHIFKLNNNDSIFDMIINTNFSFCVYNCEGKYITAQFMNNNYILVYDKDKLLEIEYSDDGICKVKNLNTVYTSSNYPFVT